MAGYIYMIVYIYIIAGRIAGLDWTGPDSQIAGYIYIIVYIYIIAGWIAGPDWTR